MTLLTKELPSDLSFKDLLKLHPFFPPYTATSHPQNKPTRRSQQTHQPTSTQTPDPEPQQHKQPQFPCPKHALPPTLPARDAPARRAHLAWMSGRFSSKFPGLVMVLKSGHLAARAEGVKRASGFAFGFAFGFLFMSSSGYLAGSWRGLWALFWLMVLAMPGLHGRLFLFFFSRWFLPLATENWGKVFLWSENGRKWACSLGDYYNGSSGENELIYLKVTLQQNYQSVAII